MALAIGTALAAAGKVIGGLTGKQIALGGMGALWAGSEAKDWMRMGSSQKNTAKELSIQEMMGQGQLSSATAVNEANRQAAQEYMAMFRSEKAEDRSEKAEARKMQLIMMMIGGMQNLGQQAASNQFQQDVGPPPPTSMMALLGGR